MEKRRLGSQGLEVAEIGLGCMSMTGTYGTADEAEAIATIQRALDLGVTMLDTAESYGPFTNEMLVGRAIKGRRDQVIIATKVAWAFDDKGQRTGLDGRAEHVRQACEGCLRRLGVDYIDLLYLHRRDPAVPIEETVGAMADLVRAGKVRYIGLSEVSAETIRRAHAVHPLTAVQSEYSLWERGVERSVLPTMRELGIGFVSYSPLGRGFLTGNIRRADDLAPNDYRHTDPRFQGANLEQNLKLVEQVQAIAREMGATPGQVAIAWMLHRGKDIVPIPGTKRRSYLEENLAAASLKLDQATLERLEAVARPGVVVGQRYGEALLKMVEE